MKTKKTLDEIRVWAQTQIDEATKLEPKTLESVADHHDFTVIGGVLLFTPEEPRSMKEYDYRWVRGLLEIRARKVVYEAVLRALGEGCKTIKALKALVKSGG